MPLPSGSKFTLIYLATCASMLGSIKEVIKLWLKGGDVSGNVILFPLMITCIWVVIHFAGRLSGKRLSLHLIVGSLRYASLCIFTSAFGFIFYGSLISSESLGWIYETAFLSSVATVIGLIFLKAFYARVIKSIGN